VPIGVLGRGPDALQGRFGSFAPQLALFDGREQIWDARELANAWGLGDMLGDEATGWGSTTTLRRRSRSRGRTRSRRTLERRSSQQRMSSAASTTTSCCCRPQTSTTRVVGSSSNTSAGISRMPPGIWGWSRGSRASWGSRARPPS